MEKYQPKSPIKKNNFTKSNEHNLFSFTFFNGHSVKLKDFNNYYANQNDTINSINDFFETLHIISNMKSTELYSNNMKKQLHYNEFTNDIIIDRIENVLLNGYGMSESIIEDFERSYFEFAFSNGKRVIGTKIYNNIFELLFIDCNHMICLESSRMIKNKLMFEFPSYFGKFKDKNYKQFNNSELLKLLIIDAKNGFYDSLNDFINDCEEILNIVDEEKEYV